MTRTPGLFRSNAQIVSLGGCIEKGDELEPQPPGLDALWGSLTEGLSPEGIRVMRRVLMAQALLLAEMIRLAEETEAK